MIGETFHVQGCLFQRFPMRTFWCGDLTNPCRYCDLGFHARPMGQKKKRCRFCKELKCDNRINRNLTIVKVACPVEVSVLRRAYAAWQRMMKRRGGVTCAN